jgi:MYXO-CTERM domain-containing protein
MRATLCSSTLALSLFAAGCLGGVAPEDVGAARAPIIGGTLDTADPGVVLVFAQQPGSQSGSLCTGEVVSPHVVMTAAHCVSPSEVGQGAVFTVFTGDDFNQATQADLLPVKETHPNPNWDANNLPGGSDVGVVILQNATTIRPLPFNHAAMTQALVGQNVRFVGYGLDDALNQTGAGVKRVTSTVLSDYDTVKLHFTDGTHETCNGDSGGPAFMTLSGVETIVGVTSYGDPNCNQGGYDTRIDSVSTFVDGYVQTNDPSMTPPSSPPAGDGGSTPPASDPGSGDSSGSGSSAGQGQAAPGTTALAQIGDACRADADCATHTCGIGPVGTQVCVTAQSPNNATIGGCSVALGGPGGESASALLLVLFGLGGLLARRRYGNAGRGVSENGSGEEGRG